MIVLERRASVKDLRCLRVCGNKLVAYWMILARQKTPYRVLRSILQTSRGDIVEYPEIRVFILCDGTDVQQSAESVSTDVIGSRSPPQNDLPGRSGHYLKCLASGET